MDFENKIKEIAESAFEVPDGFVWERISATLRKRAARRMYIRRGIYATASVAAAVLLLLFIDTGNPVVNKTQKEKSLIANSIPSGVISAQPVSESGKDVNPVKHKITVLRAPREERSSGIAGQLQPAAAEEKATIGEQQQSASGNSNSNNRTKDKNQLNEKLKRSPYSSLYSQEIEDIQPVKNKRKLTVGTYTNLGAGTYRSILNMYQTTQIDQDKTFLTLDAPEQTPNSIEDGTGVVSDIRYSAPLIAGLQVQIPVGRKLSVNTGVLYTYLKTDVKTVVSETEGFTTITRMHYIGIPLNFTYNVISTDKIRFYASAGATIEKGVRASVETIGAGVLDGTINTSVDPLAFSIAGGMGVEYMLTKRLGAYADPGIVYYFDTNQPVSIRTTQPLQYKFELGLRLHL